MTSLAPILESFFTDRLLTQRQASPHTVAAYRDTFRLLLSYAFERTGKHPVQLDIAELDAPLIAAFLQHLETDRGNGVSTRNARLAAIHSLFRYAALRAPEHAALIARVLAMPSNRQHRPLVCFLDREEIEALLAAPDQTHPTGRRDHAVLLVLTQTPRIPVPSGDPQDPGFRRLRYTRYADDHLLGFIGPKAEAEAIKDQLER
ncbi:MAG: site-specific integrase, partial [Pseudonocardia sp.]